MPMVPAECTDICALCLVTCNDRDGYSVLDGSMGEMEGVYQNLMIIIGKAGFFMLWFVLWAGYLILQFS